MKEALSPDVGGGASFALLPHARFCAGCTVPPGLCTESGIRPRSYRGTRPRFASGTLMSLRTIPPFRAGVLCGCGRVFRKRPQGVSRALSPPAGACRCTFRKRHQGTLSGALRSEARRERSAREGGFPCRSVGRCAPAASLGKGRGTRTNTGPHTQNENEERSVRITRYRRSVLFKR